MQRFLLFLFLLSSTTIFAQPVSIYSESFDTGFGSWMAIDVSDATDIWTATGGYLEMNGYGGSDDEDWLISPAINMNTYSNEYLLFDYNDGFNGGLIELYYSTDFSGSNSITALQNATWTNISLDLIDISATSCVSSVFLPHTAVDVSSITGNAVYFAFKYLGTSTNSKRYRIDNFHIDGDYYTGVEAAIQSGLSCDSLKTAIHQLIAQNINVIPYTDFVFDTWDAMLVADRRLNDAANATIVWDMFTDIPNGTGEFEYDHCNDKDNGSCPNVEGNCYNREHTFPRSWWGGSTVFPNDSINFDMHHLVPSDRYLNTTKSNFPPGEVANVSVTGSNGFKFGSNTAYPCSSMNYFEPIDEYKGDYARIFLYIATRYESSIASWATINNRGDCALAGNAYPAYEPWLINLLLNWHANDPVSQKELDRNNAVYAIQGNRNPFIDHPSWIGYVWGDHLGNSCSQLVVSCTTATGTDTQVACSTYTWINGITYTSNNNTATYTYNGGAYNGCDSVVTLNLSILNASTGLDIQSACNSFTWIDGNTYTSNNNTATYTYNGGAYNGCDSTVTLNLTIFGTSSSIDQIYACSSYTWINGVTYTNSNNTATVTLQTSFGCDSIVSLDLVIGNFSSGTDIQSACNSFTWIDGNTYTSSNNTATWTIPNGSYNGCDSVVILNLSLSNPTSGTDLQNACNSYTWIDGITYTSSNNTATWIIPNGSYNGCDSIVSLDLTVVQIDTSLIMNGGTLTANQQSSSYQWIDCNTNLAISGALSQAFTPIQSGSYAVVIEFNNCVDTSSCFDLNVLQTQSLQNEININVFPNPFSDQINIQASDLITELEYQLFDVHGRCLFKDQYPFFKTKKINLSIPGGFYILKLFSNQTGYQYIKILKE